MVSNYRRKTRSAINKLKTEQRLVKARQAKRQIAVTARVRNCVDVSNAGDAQLVCLNGIANILKKRVEAHERGELYSGHEEAIACHHLSRISASQICKFTKGEFRLQAFHNREYFSGARSQGQAWEQKWAMTEEFSCYGRFRILQQVHEPFRESIAFPWVCATPDFISLVQLEDQTPFWTVIEVKSYKKKKEMVKYKSQIRTAMSCFGLKTGFLVIYHTLKPTAPPQIVFIDDPDYLETNREQMEFGYFNFLTRMLNEMFYVRICRTTVQNVIQKVLPKVLQPEFRQCWTLASRPNKRDCYYNGARFGQVLKRVLPKFTKGVPSVLAAPEQPTYSYKSNLQNAAE